MSQVTEQSVRFQIALASIKLMQASVVLDLTEDDFYFLTSHKDWIATDRSRVRRCVEACVYGTLDFVVDRRLHVHASTRQIVSTTAAGHSSRSASKRDNPADSLYALDTSAGCTSCRGDSRVNACIVRRPRHGFALAGRFRPWPMLPR